MSDRPRFLSRRDHGVAIGFGVLAGLADLLGTWWLGQAIADLLRPAWHGTTPTPAHAALVALWPLAGATTLMAIRHSATGWVADRLAQRADGVIAHRLVDRAVAGDGLADLLVRGPQAAESVRQGLAIAVRTGTLVTVPLTLVLIGVFTSPWIAISLLFATLASVPFYVTVGRRSALRAQTLTSRRVVTTAGTIRAIEAAPTLRGLGATEVAVHDVHAATWREHEEANAAVALALGSTAISEFLAGVGVGLVAMVLGFGLLHRTGLTPDHVHHAVLGVLLTAQLFTAWRSRGADFHARESFAQTMDALAPPQPRPEGAPEVAAADLVTVEGQAPLRFTWRTGEVVHITGPSGSGKSALLAVVCGRTVAQNGTLSATLPHPIFVIAPDVPLLATSLAENIALSRPHVDVHELIRTFNLGDVARRMADGADCASLSDGERVRVLAARAVARPGATIVIDDIGTVLPASDREILRDRLATCGAQLIVEAGHGPWLTVASQTLEVLS